VLFQLSATDRRTDGHTPLYSLAPSTVSPSVVYQIRAQKDTVSIIIIIIIIIIKIYLPSVVIIPRVKSSKKLKSKAGVAMHLNRPGTTRQQKSHEIERS